LCLTNVSLSKMAIEDEAVYKPVITVPISLLIHSNKAIDMFVAYVHPSELGRCEVR
jgi:hypothetical protein